ncbi:MAG: hypothetical protein CVT67_06780 [Actinobacteria bacterium HGW-Actinobacteria-7]|nr:MAG: hypothetical protein CVT67_06780 [Actinobacteria bacterium HGW-Actinobacteria-7]
MDSQTPATFGYQPSPSSPQLADLEDKVGRQRRTIIILWIVIAVVVCCGCVVVSGVALTAGFLFATDSASTNDVALRAVEQRVRSVYGTDLATVTAEPVTTVDQQDPFAKLYESQKYLHVAYRLKETDVTVSAMVTDINFLRDEGVLPPDNALASRLSTKQFVQLLEAYGAQTSRPAAGALRYTEAGTAKADEETIDIEQETFRTAELWLVPEGVVAREGRVVTDLNNQLAHIFVYDDKLGTFRFVGTEQWTSDQAWGEL